MSSGGPDVLYRSRDVAVAALGLVALSPVIGATYLLVRFKLGSPAIFRQERPGLGGKVFTIYKLRTMLPVDPERGWVTDEQRLTRFGRTLRSTSLDELPSLVNVLRGDMSLVGPRPLLVEYLERYTPTQARRHEVRPGLTGLAQVYGRNAITWDLKLVLDVWYVDHRSAWLDLRILGRTVALVLSRSGISPDGHATMPEFQGRAGGPAASLGVATERSAES